MVNALVDRAGKTLWLVLAEYYQVFMVLPKSRENLQIGSRRQARYDNDDFRGGALEDRRADGRFEPIVKLTPQRNDNGRAFSHASKQPAG